MIWVDPDASGRGDRAPRGIDTDNLAMGRMAWENVSRHFAPLQQRGIEDLAPQPARFVQAVVVTR